MLRPGPLLLSLLVVGSCAKRPPVSEGPPPDPLQVQKDLAAQDTRSRALELCRLASLALAEGQIELAESALRQAVGILQDFRADGEFAAFVGQESAKEWKGEPFEKMMAFLYLGLLLHERGEHGNALAMAKSALLADTGTVLDRYRADFLPAYVLQALAYQALGERTNAERTMEHAVDALGTRVLTDVLSGLLLEIALPAEGDAEAFEAGRALLLGGLPAGLTAHPRDAQEAIDGALSWATDARRIALQAKKHQRPDAAAGLRRRDLEHCLPHLETLARQWKSSATDPKVARALTSLEGEQAFLRSLVTDPPRLLLWLETGRGPEKVATGRYGEALVMEPGRPGRTPRLLLNDQPLQAELLEDVTYQALTRGGRRVDRFLAGKAVFKDSSGVLGYAMLVGGDIAQAADEPAVSAVLYIAGAFTWLAGALTNPRADTRQWEQLPGSIWLARADPPPGTHTLTVRGRSYTVNIPDEGSTVHLVPGLPPHGARSFGQPCIRCNAPLASPDGGFP